MKDIIKVLNSPPYIPSIVYINGIPHIYDNDDSLYRIDTHPEKVIALGFKFTSYEMNMTAYDRGEIRDLMKYGYPGTYILTDKGDLIHYVDPSFRFVLGNNILAMTIPFSGYYTQGNYAKYPQPGSSDFVVLTDDNIVRIVKSGKMDEYPEITDVKRNIPLDKKIIKGYNLGNRLFTILQTDDNKLYMWEPSHQGLSPNSYEDNLYKIPGKEVKKIAKSMIYTSSIPAYYTDAFLTDEGLFHVLQDDRSFKLLYGHIKGDPIIPHKLYNQFFIYNIDLPEGLSPDDIEEILAPHYNNLFLLDKQGRVYSIGENDYYQRGVQIRLDPRKWNQIEYPEPIKQIHYGKFPGLFALSKSGNLYYHGSTEYSDEYLEPTADKIRVKAKYIDKPTTIGTGVNVITSGDNTVLVIDENGEVKSYPLTYLKYEPATEMDNIDKGKDRDRDKSKRFKGRFVSHPQAFSMAFRSMIKTLDRIHEAIQIACEQIGGS